MNIAVFGGSFNPIGLNHLFVVGHILMNDPDIDQVMVIPCFEQEGKNNLAPFDLRLEMCNAALKYFAGQRVIVSDIERNTRSFTVETLRLLHEISPPGDHFRFVMGADLIEPAKTWDGWEEIERLAPPYIVGRAGISNSEATPICPAVSSTLVRQLLEAGDYLTVEKYLCRDVLDIIKRENLYINKEVLSVLGKNK